jgi:ATP-binding cassette subfamily B protein
MPPSRMPRTGNEGKQMKRLLSDLWKGYKKELIIVTICLLLTSISNTAGSLFSPRIINEVITPVIKNI